MRIIIWAGLVLVIVVIGSCFITPPERPQSWELVLRGPDTLYRDPASGYVNNDTILVRLVRDSEVVVSGVAVHCQCEISRDSLTQFVTTYSDTIAHVAGCYPALMYWGAGSADTVVYECIHCWALPYKSDTLHASIQFKVFDPQ